jgi:hypothetical protein
VHQVVVPQVVHPRRQVRQHCQHSINRQSTEVKRRGDSSLVNIVVGSRRY